MKPAPFRYLAPRSLKEALAELANQQEDVRILAGGQSLGPLLNLRLARPEVVLDVNRLDDLAGLTLSPEGHLAIGAMARQRSLEISAIAASGWDMLVAAISEVGHRAIRNRGTVGGSVAHADPAAELPAALVALDASFSVASAAGNRSIRANEFFLGPFTTALAPDEMLIGMTVPPVAAGTGQTWLEFSRRHGDFGLVGVAATLRIDGERKCRSARLVYSGSDLVPWEPASALQALEGRRPSSDLFMDVGRAVAAESSPPADVHASTAHRRKLMSALATRALTRCAAASRYDTGSP